MTGENKGFAYITFSKASEAAYALEECDPTYKPKFAEPFSSKRHRDAEETLPSSASLYGAFSPPHRRLNKAHPSPTNTDRRLSPPPSLSRTDSISPAYHLLENNNERRLIIRCGITITKYHISKLFDLVPSMEECSPIGLNSFNERKMYDEKFPSLLNKCLVDYFLVRYKSAQYATYAREKLHAFQFPDGEMLSVQYYDEK